MVHETEKCRQASQEKRYEEGHQSEAADADLSAAEGAFHNAEDTSCYLGQEPCHRLAGGETLV
jgi:hypothetical protein